LKGDKVVLGIDLVVVGVSREFVKENEDGRISNDARTRSMLGKEGAIETDT
jgi:hypothetical protein